MVVVDRVTNAIIQNSSKFVMNFSTYNHLQHKWESVFKNGPNKVCGSFIFKGLIHF